MIALLNDSLRSISHFLDIHSRSLYKSVGITSPQLAVLIALGNDGQLPVSKVAEMAHLSIATISGTVSRLVDNGLVQRIQSSEDKRIVLLNLTDKGGSILKSVTSPLPENFSKRFENDIPEWEKNMILSSLQKVTHLMQDNE